MVLLAFVYCLSSFAQSSMEEIEVYHSFLLNTDNGLISDEVRSSHRDRSGLLWIGMETGLQVYTGTELFNPMDFLDCPFLPPSLEVNHEIAEDKYGNIWVSTERNGIVRIDPKSWSCEVFNTLSDPSLPAQFDHVHGVQMLKDGIYACTVAGVFYYREEDKQWIDLLGTDSWTAEQKICRGLTLDPARNLLMMNRKGMLIRDSLGHWSEHPIAKQIHNDSKKLNPSLTSRMVADSSMFYAYWGKMVQEEPQLLYKINLFNNSIDSMPLANSKGKDLYDCVVYKISLDAEGHFWVGTNKNGLYKISKHLTSELHLTEEHPLLALPSNTINHIRKTENEELLISTNGGLLILKPTGCKPKFVATLPMHNDSTRSTDHFLEFKKSADGTVAFGLFNFLYLIDTSGEIRHRMMGDFAHLDMAFISDSFLICKPTGSKRMKLYSLNEQKYSDKKLPDYLYPDLLQYGRQFLLIEPSGISILDSSSLEIQSQLFLPRHTWYVHSKNRGIDICNGKGECLHLDAETGRVEPYQLNLPPSTLLSAVLAHDDNFYAGTYNSGLFSFKTVSQRNWHLTDQQGLLDNRVKLIKRRKDELLVFTQRGLHLVNPQTGEILWYCYYRDLFGDVNLQNLAMFDNQIWFNTDEGLFKLDFASIPKPGEEFREIYLRRLDYEGRSHFICRRDTTVVPKLNLHWRNNELGFALALKYELEPGEKKIYYRLKGLEENWNESNRLNEGIYNKLPGGSYELQVRQKSFSGQMSAAKTVLLLGVQTPFWENPFFYLMLILLLLASVVIFFRLRIQKIIALERLRSGIAKDLHDDMGSSLSSIQIMSQMAKHDVSKAGKYLEYIGRQSSDIIQYMEDLLWVIQPENDRLKDLKQKIQDYILPLADSKGIIADITIPKDIENTFLPIKVKKNLYLVIKEALNNALKHSGATEISLNIGYNSGFLETRISDNGVGFDIPKSSEDLKGYGLDNMRNRIHEVGGNFSIETDSNGTSIFFSINLK